MSSYRVVSSEERPASHDYVLVVEQTPSRWAALLGARPRVYRFVGAGTVWRTMPSYARVGDAWELRLADLLARERAEGRVT